MDHVSIKPFNKPFNKPYEDRNTMSAFSAKEVAVLSGNTNVVGLKIHPLKEFIARRYPQSEWDQAYIMAWQILTAMATLTKRNTTPRVTWYWGIPYTPRSYQKDGAEFRIPYIATSEADENTLPSIWKHEHGRLLTLLRALGSRPAGDDIYTEFELHEVRLNDVDRMGNHVQLSWRPKAGCAPFQATNAMFIRTSLQGKDDSGLKVQNSGLTGAARADNKITDMYGSKGVVGLPKPGIDDPKRRPLETRGERTYARGQTPVLTHVDDSPYSNRKGENAKRHDRRKAGGKNRRSKWDD